MCQASEELSIAYELSQDFVGLFKEHKAQALKDWLRRAKGSTISELKSLAKSMRAAITPRLRRRVLSLGIKVRLKGTSIGSNA